MKTVDKMTAFPIAGTAKKDMKGYKKDSMYSIFIQVITNGFAVYKSSKHGKDREAGYATYESMEDILKDFEFSDDDMNDRIDDYLI